MDLRDRWSDVGGDVDEATGVDPDDADVEGCVEVKVLAEVDGEVLAS